MDSEEGHDPILELATGESHPLIEACKHGNYEHLNVQIKKFADKDKPLTVRDLAGWQAVHYAAKLTDVKCLSALLEQDSCLALSTTRDKTTPLIVAAGLANIDAVKALLPFLDADDVSFTNVHGLNALYYAVAADTPRGNQICHLLIEHGDPTNVKYLECASSFDTLPFRVVKNKNAEILTAMLHAGLNPAYAVEEDKFEDDSYAPHVCSMLPVTLIGYCVKEDWMDGVTMVIASQQKWISTSKRDNGVYQVRELFTAGTSDFNRSALQIICAKGCIKYLKLVFEHGYCFESEDALRVIQSKRRFSSTFTMSVAVANDIWGKSEFLKYFLSHQSCAQFNQHYKKVLTEFIDEYLPQNHLVTCVNMLHRIIHHPFQTVTDAILHCSDEHSIGESVQLLLDYNFTFDFDIPFYYEPRLGWRNVVTALICEGINDDSRYFEIAVELLDRNPHMALTMDALPAACEFLDEHRPSQAVEEGDNFSHKWSHLAIMKALAGRSHTEINKAYEHVYIEAHTIEATRMFDNEEDNQISSCNAERGWLTIAQLLLKGFKTRLGSDTRLISWKNEDYVPNIPFSLLFLKDDERQHFITKACRECTDPFELQLKKERLSSLQFLCRRVIRDKIGFARLIREPVPRAKPCEVTKENSWEVSSIDQLACIPTLLRNYLKFIPELEQYSEYFKRFKQRYEDPNLN